MADRLQSIIFEHRIRKTLKRIARQRVLRLHEHLNSHENVWVIRHALRHLPATDELLATCRLRGWIEVLDNAIPAPHDYRDGIDDCQHLLDLIEPLYRLTGAGWDTLHHRQGLFLTSTTIAVLSISISATMLLITVFKLYGS